MGVLRFVSFVLATVLFCSSNGWAQVEHKKLAVRGVPLHVVTIDLDSPEVSIRPVMAPRGQALDFKSMLARTRPAAAITGTFFDTGTNIVVGNVVADGRLLTEGSVGSVITIDDEGKAELRSLKGKLGRHLDWAGVQFAVSGGPTLIDDGQIWVEPRGEGFSDPGLFGRRQRAAMGLTKDHKMLLVTTGEGVSLNELARIMQALGSYEAINLDGGSSTALYCQGQVLAHPRRRLTNLVAVYTKGAPVDTDELSNQYAKAYQHFLQGQRLFRQGNLLVARSQLRKALAMAPDRAPYWKVLGEVEEARKDAGAALQAYLKAAHLYIDRSQTEDALGCLAAARNIDPEHPDTLALQQILGQ